MQDVVRQAKISLSIYLDRGECAVRAFDQGLVDEASDWLKKRTAAFHNFRAVEALIPRPHQGVDPLAYDAEVQATLARLAAVEQRLAVQLEAAHQETAETMQRLRLAQQKISRYRSGGAEFTKFEQSA